MYEVRVREDFRYNHARVAGREFNKGQVEYLSEQQMTAEIRESPLLDMSEVPASAQALGEVDATNAARTLAQELGVDLASVDGSGEEGRILKADVARAAAALSGDEQEADNGE